VDTHFVADFDRRVLVNKTHFVDLQLPMDLLMAVTVVVVKLVVVYFHLFCHLLWF